MPSGVWLITPIGYERAPQAHIRYTVQASALLGGGDAIRLARFDIDAEQAARWWDQSARNIGGLNIGGEEITDGAILKNPYLIYECDRLQPGPIAFRTIDQGAFPEKAIASAHPIPEPSAMKGPVDGRRLRAATAAILERAANDGHTLLAREEIIAQIRELGLSPALPATDDQYEIHSVVTIQQTQCESAE